jgi:hypothetical protein
MEIRNGKNPTYTNEAENNSVLPNPWDSLATEIRAQYTRPAKKKYLFVTFLYPKNKTEPLSSKQQC